MKIIDSSFQLMDPKDDYWGVEKLRNIEYYARISHRSEEKQSPDSYKRFLKAVVLEHGDWSVTEHEKATVLFRVDRALANEITRHRLFSFTQESTRFVNYGKREIEFVRPGFTAFKSDFDPLYWELAVKDAGKAYLDLLSVGQPPEIARSVLPLCTATTLVMTGNLRSWRHFFIVRTTLEAHRDLKKVTIPLLEQFKSRIPILYEDITSNERQAISMAKAK
jgi:thymidylate synthase (FAD)